MYMESEHNHLEEDDDDLDNSVIANKINLTNIENESSSKVDEQIVEQFIESLMASENTLKVIEKKLTHLDLTLHEKSNSIMQYLKEIKTATSKTSQYELDGVLRNLRNDLEHFKSNTIDKIPTMTKVRGKT